MVQLSSLAFAACTVLTSSCSQLGAGGSVWAGSTDLGHRSTLARQLIQGFGFSAWNSFHHCNSSEPGTVLLVRTDLYKASWSSESSLVSPADAIHGHNQEQLCLFLNASDMILSMNLSMFKPDFCLYQSKILQFLFGDCCIQWFCLCP